MPGETRDLRRVRTRTGSIVVAARNDDRALAFRVLGGGASPARPAAGRVIAQRMPTAAPRGN